MTLMNMRARAPDQDLQARETEYACSRAMAMVSGEVECSSGKPAFQILEYFLSKGVLNASKIMAIAQRNQNTQFIEHFHEDSPLGEISFPSEQSEPEWTSQVQRFISDILSWMEYPDTAAIAGHLLSLFTKSLQSCPQENAIDTQSWLSICMDLIKKSLNEHPNWLDPVRNHVLPDLFKLLPKDTLMLLQEMPLLELSQGDVAKLSDAEIEMCMLSVETAEKFGFLPNLGT